MSFLIVATLFSGCSLIKYPPYRLPTPSPDLIERARQSNGEIRSVRGIGRVEVVSQGKKLRSKQFILVGKPDMMRIDLLDFRGLPFLRLAFRGETFQAMDMRENVFYFGEVARGISLFVPLRINSREFVALLLGEMPSQEQVLARYDAHRRLYELTFPPSIRWESQTFWIHPKTLRVKEVSKIGAATGEVIRVSFSRFRRSGHAAFPREVKIEVPGAENRIRFSFQTIDINPRLPRELFRLTIPRGAEVVEIEDEMDPRRLTFPVQQ